MCEVIWARRAEALHQTLTLVRSLGLFDSRLSQQVRSTCGRGAIGHLASFPGDRIAPSSSPSCLLSRAALPFQPHPQSLRIQAGTSSRRSCSPSSSKGARWFPRSKRHVSLPSPLPLVHPAVLRPYPAILRPSDHLRIAFLAYQVGPYRRAGGDGHLRPCGRWDGGLAA